MDFHLPEELQILRDTTRRFVQKELYGLASEIDEKRAIPESTVRRLKDLGYFGLTTPEEYGGMGLATLAHCLVQEELAWAHPCFNLLISGNNGIGSLGILYEGSEDQKRTYLPKLARGEYLSAFALTEPGAGSDAAAIQTTAERKNGGYELNGRKHFITRADIADLLTVMAVSDKQKRSRGGITAFVVEKKTSGLSIGRIQGTMGDDVIHACEVVFEGCWVPEASVIGSEGNGFRVAMRVLDTGRLNVGARSLGMADHLLKLSVDYSKQRVAFGNPISHYQAIQWMMADMAVEIQALRSMLYETAWRKDEGEEVTRATSIVKLFGSGMVCRAADRALQIHGGMGYMREFPIERIYREARAQRIIEGTDEIQRLIIARELLKN